MMKTMNTRIHFPFAVSLLCCFVTAGCSQEPKSATGDTVKIQLTSTAFADGQPIPAKYTGDGRNVSPPLAWTNIPPGAKSFALIADDPDAPSGDWTHWVMYNMPSIEVVLSENIAKTETLDDGRKQGKNSFGNIGYDGPAPPRGKAHRYFFKLFALDAMLDLKSGATKADLLKAMDGHVLGEGRLMGTFQRN
jgi:Raf kinase inhibitor-like YbhB/YbcL family protein